MNQPRRASPAVYRRRRLVAVLLAIFLVALIIWGIRGVIDLVTHDDDSQELTSAQGEQSDSTAADDPPAEPDEAEETDTAEQPQDTPQDEENNQSEDNNQDEDTDQNHNNQDTEDTADSENTGEDSDEDLPEGHCAPSDISVRASTNREEYGIGVAPRLVMEIENTGDEECTLDVGTAEQSFRISHDNREIFTTSQCDINGDSLELDFQPGQTESAHLTWPRSDSAIDCAQPADLPGGEYHLRVSVSGITSEPHSFHLIGGAQ